MIVFGNLVYYIFWPLLFLQTLYKKKLSHQKKWIILSIFTFTTVLINPASAKYGFAFLLFILFRLKFSNIYAHNLFLISIIFSCLLIEFVPRYLLFNPLDIGFKTFRYKAFFTEPAYLGYWSAFAAYESLKLRKFKKSVIYLGLLVLSSSVGAFIYFFLTLLTRSSKRYILIAILFGILIFFFFENQIISKISSDSYSMIFRIENLTLAWESIIKNYGVPQGFGPLNVKTDQIGIMSGLLFFKAYGLLLLPLVFLIRFKVIRFIPALFLFLMVGNYWETPLLWHLKKK